MKDSNNPKKLVFVAYIFLVFISFYLSQRAIACNFQDETFDTYPNGISLHGLNGWQGWDNNPAATAYVTQTQFLSPPQSIDINGASNLVYPLCGSGGVWSYSAWQYIPSDFVSGSGPDLDGSFFVMLNRYPVDADPGTDDWSVRMQFDSNDGMLKVYYGNGLNTVNVPYDTDRWVKIQVIVDLDNDWTNVYYDDELVTEYPWTGGVLGDGGGSLDIAGVDLYANGSTSVYYDDLKFEQITPTPSCGEPGTVKLDADLNFDLHVDILDLQNFGLDWLGGISPSDIFPPSCGDGSTNLLDFSAFAADWGECVDPSDPMCNAKPLTLYEPPGSCIGNSTILPFSGEFTESNVDMYIPGRGTDFNWTRTYRSRLGSNSAMGNGWDFTHNIYVRRCGSSMFLNDGHNRSDRYRLQPNGTWISGGFFRVLSQNPDTTLTLTFPDSRRWIFHLLDGSVQAGKIKEMIDRNGNITSYDYDTQGRLITIHDTLDTASHNRDITISYNPNGFIELVTDFTGRSIAFQYYNGVEPGGNFGDLKSVTSPAVTVTPTGNDFPDGKTIIYTYSTGFENDCLNHNLLTITDPNNQTYLVNTYDPTTNPADMNFDRVTRQILGDPGDIIDFTYLQQVPDPSNNYAVTRVVVNDRMGNVRESFFDNMNRIVIEREYTGRANPDLPTSINPDDNLPTSPLRISDPSYFETRYEYNTDSLLTRVVYPNLNEKQFVYDSLNTDVRSRRNLLQCTLLPGPLGGDQSQIIELFEYDPFINHDTNMITRYVDGRGNETLYDYDTNGNLTSKTIVRPADPNIVETWTYNTFGQMTGHLWPDNGSSGRRQDAFNYYGLSDGVQNGYLKESIVGFGVFDLTTTYEYDTVGNMIRIIDPNGSDTQFVYNQLDQVVRTISPEVTDGSSVRYERDTYYDENDNIIRIDVQNKDEDGLLDLVEPYFSTEYEYDILNYMTRTIQDFGTADTVVNEYEYDANRNKTLIRFGDGARGSRLPNTVSMIYDERDLLFVTIRAESDPNQSSVQYDYDGNRNLIRISEGLEDVPRISLSIYDGYDRVIQTSDPMGNVTELQYDSNDNVVHVMNKGELVDTDGSSANVRLHEVSHHFDEINRMILSETSFFDPVTQLDIDDGKVTTLIEYNDVSQVVRITDDLSRQSTYEYDGLNRLKIEIDPKGNSKTYSYDDKSNVKSIKLTDKSDLLYPDETFTTTYVYDNMDRRTLIIDNDGNLTQNRYDSRDNLTSATDALSNKTRYSYDSLNRLIETVRDMDGDGADGDGTDIVITQGWDYSSRLSSKTDDNGNTTMYEYDNLNRRTRTIYADGTSAVNKYDVHDNLIEHVDANGSQANYTYNKNNKREQSLYFPETGISNDTTFHNFEYDGLGRIVSAQNDGSTVLRAYDSISNVMQETINGTATSSTYDSLGNKLSITYPGGRVVNMTYDQSDRKKTLSSRAGMIATYDYVGNRTERVQFGNFTETNYTYDNLGRITAITHSGSSTSIIDERTFMWDPLGNKTQRKDIRTGGPELTHTYEYDPMYRLKRTIVNDALIPPTTISDTQYALDGVGNRTNVTGFGSLDLGPYLLDPTLPAPGDFQMNQYSQTPWLNIIEYDDNGNLIAMSPSAVSPPVTSTYDVLDRLVEVADLSTGTTTTYAYDAIGRRIRKTIAGPAGPPTTTHYYYDNDRVVEEQDDTGTTLATYVYGNYIDEVLSMQRGGMDYYYHADDLFNVMALTDITGTVVERYKYDDFGKPDFVLLTGAENPFLFNSRRYDSESGLYYYRTRYMDPRTGRFTSRDTLGAWGDSGNLGNGNAYAGNNPWSNLDPFGLMKGDFSRGHNPTAAKKAREIVVVGSKVKEVVRSAMKVRPLNDRVLLSQSTTPSGLRVAVSELKAKTHFPLYDSITLKRALGGRVKTKFPWFCSRGESSNRSANGERLNSPTFGAGIRRNRIPKHNPIWTNPKASSPSKSVDKWTQALYFPENMLVAVANPNLLEARKSQNESSAATGAGAFVITSDNTMSLTREHILLGRQVGIPASSNQSHLPEYLRHRNRAFIPEIDDEVLTNSIHFVDSLSWN